MWVDKHQDHIKKLETLLRMLDNDQVSVQQIKDIQEEIDNYIENCQEPDFIENEYIYDDIDGLDEMLRDVSLKHNSDGNGIAMYLLIYEIKLVINIRCLTT